MADSDFDNAGVKAVITLGVLALVGILAIVIAKIVQYCVNKHYTDDGGGHIDENTRELIRARLSVSQYKKREFRKAQRMKSLNIFKKWKDFVKSRKKDREEALKSQRPQRNGQVVITIDKEDGSNVKENGVVEIESNTIQENGTARIPRFPFFAQTKTSGGGVKPHSETPRISTSLKTNTVTPEVPVPRGRPVSSKQRILPHKTVTNADVNSSTKILVKSVHFEDDIENVNTKNERDNPSIKTGTEVTVDINVNKNEKTSIKGISSKDNEKKDRLNNNLKTDEKTVIKAKSEIGENDKINNNISTVKLSANVDVGKENKDSAKSNIQHNKSILGNTESKDVEKPSTKVEHENKSGEKT